MVSALYSRSGGPGSSPSRGRGVAKGGGPGGARDPPPPPLL